MRPTSTSDGRSCDELELSIAERLHALNRGELRAIERVLISIEKRRGILQIHPRDHASEAQVLAGLREFRDSSIAYSRGAED